MLRPSELLIYLEQVFSFTEKMSTTQIQATIQRVGVIAMLSVIHVKTISCLRKVRMRLIHR